MVVLINEGTRSGKESLAFQLKKGDRSVVIGSRTAGAFTAGKGVFADREDADYIFYMAVMEPRLDGETIEGKGVEPDIEVPYPLDGTIDEDPQRKAAFEAAFELARNARKAKGASPSP